MGVIAECGSCGGRHELGDRVAHRGTTACPTCGAVPYRTVGPNTDAITDPDRIAEIVSEADGVGATVAEGVADYAVSLSALATCDPAELREHVPYVGTETAQSIKQTVRSHT